GQIEVFVERHRDRGIGAETIELIDERADALLELRGRDHAGVEAQPGGARQVDAGCEIAGEGDLGERLAGRVVDDARPARVAGRSEPFDGLPGKAPGERAQSEEKESPGHRLSLDGLKALSFRTATWHGTGPRSRAEGANRPTSGMRRPERAAPPALPARNRHPRSSARARRWRRRPRSRSTSRARPRTD